MLTELVQISTAWVWVLGEWSVRWGMLIAVVIAWFAVRPPRHCELRHAICMCLLFVGISLPLWPTIGPGIFSHAKLESRPADPTEGSHASARDTIAIATGIDHGTGLDSPDDQSVTSGKPLEASEIPLQENSIATERAIAQPPTKESAKVLDGTNLKSLCLIAVASVWLLGVAVEVTRILFALVGLAKLRRQVVDVDNETKRLFAECCRQVGLPNTRIGLHDQIRSPIALGWWRPMVIIPTAWQDVDDVAKRACILHELQHIKRRDALTALLAELVRAVFFFHPLVHWLVGRLRLEREQICDNAALTSECDPRHYARVLMQFASNPGPSLVGVLQTALALPLGSRRTVKIRVHRLLRDDPSLFTMPLGWRRRAGIASIAALTIGVVGNVRILTAQAEPALLVVTANDDVPSAATAESGKSSRKNDDVAGRQKPVPAAKEEVKASNTDLYGDPLPRGALARLGTIRYRHEGWYKRIEFLPNTETFVVGTRHNTAKRWHARSGRLIRESKLDGSLKAFSISRDGDELATLVAQFDPERRESDMHLRVQDIETGHPSFEVSWTDTPADVIAMAFAPDGNVIATSTPRGKVRLWDLATGKELPNDLLINGGRIESIDFSPDGKLIAVAGQRSVALWSWLEKKEPKLLDGLERGGRVVKFSPDGELLAVGSDDHAAARLWSVESQRWQRELKGSAEWYSREGLCFSPDGSQLIVPSYTKGAIEFFDIRTGALVRTLDAGGVETRGVAISSDGKLLASVGSPAVIKVWDLTSATCISDQFVGHDEAPYELAFTPDGDHVVTGSLDDTIRVWDSNTGRQLRLMKHDKRVSGMALAPDGKLLVSCGLDNTVRLWNLESGEQIFKVVGHGKNGVIRLPEVAFTADGQQFLSFGPDLFLRVWDVSTGKALKEHAIRPKGREINAAADGTAELKGLDPFGEPGGQNSFVPIDARFFAKPGQLLISTNSAIHTFDVNSGREIDKQESENRIGDFSLSPDGRWLATSWRQQGTAGIPRNERKAILHLRESANQKATRDIEGPGTLDNITFSINGRFVAGSLFGESPVAKTTIWISVWEVETGREYARIEDFGKQTFKLAFSPDEKRLAASYADSTVLIWNLEQFRLLQPAE